MNAFTQSIDKRIIQPNQLLIKFISLFKELTMLFPRYPLKVSVLFPVVMVNFFIHANELVEKNMSEVRMPMWAIAQFVFCHHRSAKGVAISNLTAV